MPTPLYDLITPAVNAVFSRQEASLLTTLRKRQLAFNVTPLVWRRLGQGLADWQRGLISRVLRMDWQLLGDIPYVQLNKAETQELFASLATVAEVNAFKKKIASKKRTRSDQKAMKFYRASILQNPKGILWLKTRQPKGMTLVDNTLHLYTTSIDLCLQRVNGDRDYLALCFLDGNAIESLADLIITDSDAHKGGKRVVFLDFEFRNAGKKVKRRVVYKPSDVEIDYRVAGHNTDAITRLFKSQYAKGIFPEPHESFFEMLDRLQLAALNKELAGQWSQDEQTEEQLEALLSLPTYIILPRNPGSRMTADPKTKKLSIEQSYGYLEYLAFQPKPPDLGPTMQALPLLIDYISTPARWELDPMAAKNTSDWILDVPEMARPAFRLWGRLMSIACLLLQTDLHHQNQRLHGFKPHIIDMENCLIKSCPAPGGQSGTLMPEALVKVAAASGPGNTSTEGTTNQLYLRRKGQPTQWLSISEPVHALQVKEGLREALSVMSAHREEIANWVQASGLADVTVRHVAEATGNLSDGMLKFISDLLNAANVDKDSKVLLQEFMEDRRDDAVRIWKRSKSPYVKQDNPKYGLELPDYNGRDFEDRNVPVFYRRVGSLDLLTWWGEAVKYQKQSGDTKNLAFAHYHKNKGTDLLKTSLTTKLPAKAEQLDKQVEAFIDSVFPNAPQHIIGGGA